MTGTTLTIINPGGGELGKLLLDEPCKDCQGQGFYQLEGMERLRPAKSARALAIFLRRTGYNSWVFSAVIMLLSRPKKLEDNFPPWNGCASTTSAT